MDDPATKLSNEMLIADGICHSLADGIYGIIQQNYMRTLLLHVSISLNLQTEENCSVSIIEALLFALKHFSGLCIKILVAHLPRLVNLNLEKISWATQSHNAAPSGYCFHFFCD